MDAFGFYLKQYDLVNVQVSNLAAGKLYNLTYVSKDNPDDIYTFQAQSDPKQ